MTVNADPTLYADKGLISARDLRALSEQNPFPFRIFDATYALPGSHMDPRDAWQQRHIPGAHFFDIDAIADPDATLPHMAPDAVQFESHMRAFGLQNTDLVVVYDQSGLYMAAARAWWLFRLFGHHRVCVLDGGMDAWLGLGYPVSSGVEESPPESDYKAVFQPSLVSGRREIYAALEDPQTVILDARPYQRFSGEMPEPRPGMRSGHIPGSLNLPFAELLHPRDRTLLEHADLVSLFKERGIDLNKKVITTCGSGVTACVLALGLFRSGMGKASVYDGSWSEWGRDEENNPVAIK